MQLQLLYRRFSWFRIHNFLLILFTFKKAYFYFLETSFKLINNFYSESISCCIYLWSNAWYNFLLRTIMVVVVVCWLASKRDILFSNFLSPLFPPLLLIHFWNPTQIVQNHNRYMTQLDHNDTLSC